MSRKLLKFTREQKDFLFLLVSCARKSNIIQGEDLKIAEKANERIVFASTFLWLGSMVGYYQFGYFGNFAADFAVSLLASTATTPPLSRFLSTRRYEELADVAKRLDLVGQIEKFEAPGRSKIFLKERYEVLVLKDRDFLN